MDITVSSWKSGQAYAVNDIVKIDSIWEDNLENLISADASVELSFATINPKKPLVVSAYVKKTTESTSLLDPVSNLLISANIAGAGVKIDGALTNAIGVGVNFYDNANIELGSLDLRNSIKAISSDQVSHKEWFLVEKLVPEKSIPANAVKAKILLFVYGYSGGGFKFKNRKLINAHPYFYCVDTHASSAANEPNNSSSTQWTQDFLWRPSYGSSASFRGTNFTLEKEEGERFDIAQEINALPMSLSLKFDERNDKEARAIIHFLQEKYFQYQGIYNLDYTGNRNELSEVGSFKFSIGKPYKDEQHYVCREFKDNVDARNNHSISASFENLYGSTLSSVSSHNAYNPRLDFLSYIKFGGSAPYSQQFVEGVPVTLSIYTSTDANGGVPPSVGSENCQSFGVQFPTGVSQVETTDAEGNDRIFYLQNYRKVTLSSVVTFASTTITITPLETFTINSAITPFFPILIPCVTGQQSIYLDKPQEVLWYPWLRLRSFPFKASYALDIAQQPRHAGISFVDYYKKLYKVGPNQNLFTLQVQFQYRTEEEAKEILLFLEQHLGYRRFRFQLPRPYIKGDTPEATLCEKRISMFFCPEWTHEIRFKDCHLITATFIETPSGVTQEPFDVFGLSIFNPCISSKYIPNLAKYTICPESSSATAKLGAEFTSGVDYNATVRASDVVICMDISGSMGGGKSGTAAAMCRQLICTYRNDANSDYNYVSAWNSVPVALRTIYGGAIVTDEDMANNGYDLSGLQNFAIKVDERRVNVAYIKFNTGATVSNPLSPAPSGYNKKTIVSRMTPADAGGTSFNAPMVSAGNVLHSSLRSYYLKNRIVIFLTDGRGDSGLAECKKFRDLGGSKAVRLTADGPHRQNYANAVVALGGMAGDGVGGSLSDIGNRTVRDQIIERGYDPDFRDAGAPPAWVNEPLPTTVFSVVIPGGAKPAIVASYASTFGTPPEALFFQAGQTADLIKMINIIMQLTEDTGDDNYFSVNIKNCGPNPMTVKDTIVSFRSDTDRPKWTTKRTGGIFDVDGITKQVVAGGTQTAPESNTGGQYKADPNNPNWPSPDIDVPWLWKSGNIPDPVTPNKWLQLWRDGVRHDVDNPGGDSLISSTWGNNQGCDNLGIFCKDKFVRASSPASNTSRTPALEVLDLNIGNVHGGNVGGDYSHLPILQPGESLDLFFVVITNQIFGAMEELQLIVETDDGSARGTECFGSVNFNVFTQVSKEAKVNRRRMGGAVAPTIPPVIVPPAPIWTSSEYYAGSVTSDDATEVYTPGGQAREQWRHDTTADWEFGVSQFPNWYFAKGGEEMARDTALTANPVIGKWTLENPPKWLSDALGDQAGSVYLNDIVLEFFDPGIIGAPGDDVLFEFAGKGDFQSTQTYGMGVMGPGTAYAYPSTTTWTDGADTYTGTRTLQITPVQYRLGWENQLNGGTGPKITVVESLMMEMLNDPEGFMVQGFAVRIRQANTANVIETTSTYTNRISTL